MNLFDRFIMYNYRRYHMRLWLWVGIVLKFLMIKIFKTARNTSNMKYFIFIFSKLPNTFYKIYVAVTLKSFPTSRIIPIIWLQNIFYAFELWSHFVDSNSTGSTANRGSLWWIFKWLLLVMGHRVRTRESLVSFCVQFSVDCDSSPKLVSIS